MGIRTLILTATAAIALTSSADAATLVASYDFNGTLDSTVGGPALTAVDPTGGASFVTDTVQGVSRTVYQTAGANSPVTSQGGFIFSDSSAINNSTGYSVELTFEFLPGRDGAWRRILDSQDRTTDAGFYADPSNNLDIYPVVGAPSAFTSGVYRNVVLTVDTTSTSNNIKAYIDGGSNLTVSSDVMNFLNTNDVLGFFLDNTAGGGQGEWSPVRISTLNVFSGVLTSQEAESFTGAAFPPPTGAVPEPASWALMLGGFGMVGGAMRSRRRATLSIA